ncbi:MAG: DUF364 domain-containing protein [Candidatus Bathyarchaeia archaeon]
MPGAVVGDLLMYLEGVPYLAEVKVRDIRVGLGYTGVELSTGHIGVCQTLLDEGTCCQRIDKAGELSGRPALQIARLARSWKLAEAVVGVATINAMSQIIFEKKRGDYLIVENANFIDQIKINKNDTVALVGYIRPFISIIRNRTKNLYILERKQVTQEQEIFPDVACEEIVPKADVVIITGTAIANGTIDRLLELSKGARELGLVGPTASMIPEPFFKRGVTIMGGIRVAKPRKMLRIIAEGGGVPQFKDACREVVIKPKIPIHATFHAFKSKIKVSD